MRKTHTEYHKDGSIWARGYMVNGKCEGSWVWFRKNGTKMRSGNFLHGREVGEWITYDKKGKALKTTQITKQVV